MNSFLKQIESRFKLLESADITPTEEPVTESDNYVCDQCQGQGCMHCDYKGYHEELEEMSTTGGIAGYQTPKAFGETNDTAEVLGYKRVKESVNTPSAYKHGEYQQPESMDEEWTDKFAFAKDESTWQQRKLNKYPSVPMVDTPSLAPQDISEAMEKKYEAIVEGYRSFANGDPKVTPEQRVNQTIREIAKKLQEIEEAVRYTSRLKTESGMARDNYNKRTQSALNKISERLIKISERVRSLGE